ncbi:DUF6879 family protein [Streptomyces sp. NPDC020875]|uniref:DUF6879 family protein n=1 Tax=Streptomyces sp. NPDC020875 TaxID=3154898 RepID=UPI0033D10319
MRPSVPTWDELLGSARESAVHLEMRDVYAVADEQEHFAAWQAGHRTDWDDRESWWGPWHTLISGLVARGVLVRRVRIVSEPVSEYIRYEHDETTANVVSGEQVKWLPRRQASDLALPGNDFWLIDGRTIRWNHFSGDGAPGHGEISDDPAVAKLCADAFESVWSRAVPHEQYEIR